MAPDVRFVVDTTQRNTNHFAVQAPGNGIGNRGLAHTRRAHQAKNLGRRLRGQLADGNGLQDALFHLLQPEVVMLQDFGGCLDIHPLFGRFAPGQVQDGIQIIAQNRGFGGAEGLLFQLGGILQQLVFILLCQRECTDAGGILVVLLFLVRLAQLFPDGAHLLTQVVIPLVLVDGGPGFVLNLGLQAQHLHLLGQVGDGHFQAAVGVELEQELGFFGIVQAGILGNAVSHKAALVAGQHPQLHHLSRMLRQFQIGIVQRAGLPAQCLGLGRIHLLRAGNGFHQCREEGLGLLQFRNSCPGHTGDQDPDVLLRCVEQLLDFHHGTHGTQIRQLGIIHQNVLLGHQKQNLILLHSCIQGHSRFGSAHVKVNGLLRVHGQAPQRKHRHYACISNF